MLEEVRRQGAAAARIGLTIWDCPFIHASAMPAHTGERFWDWEAKVHAWEEGWIQASSDRVEKQDA
ncbi:MAG: CrpP-related protein [Pseudomonadales bacterium]